MQLADVVDIQTRGYVFISGLPARPTRPLQNTCILIVLLFAYQTQNDVFQQETLNDEDSIKPNVLKTCLFYSH